MIVTHGCTASVSGIPLDVLDAKVTLDDGWSPYGQATLTCVIPDAGDLDAIDPRNGIRLSLTVTRDMGAQARTFDLVVTERVIDHERSTMTITAATDEALLQGYSRVATTVDTSAITHQSSLQAILNNVVLVKIGSGLNKEVRRNLIPNPGFYDSTALWEGQSGVTISRDISLPAYSAASLKVIVSGNNALVNVAPPYCPAWGGTPYTFSIYVRGALGGNVHLAMQSFPNGEVFATGTTTTLADGWQRISVTGVAAPGQTSIVPLMYNSASYTGHYWACWALLETGSTVRPYFSGDGSDDVPFLTPSWVGVRNASSSKLVTHSEADWDATPATTGGDADMLDWEPGVSGWDYIAPLIEASGLRLYCDENRWWHLVYPEVPVPGQINISEGSNLTEGSETISREHDWFDSVVVKYAWTDSDGLQHTQWDSADDGSPTTTLTLDRTTAYPGPGAAQAVLSRARARGRLLDIGSLSDYKTTPGMALQASLPDTPIQTGYVSAVTWLFPDSEMTVKSRGLTDTPPTAWKFLAAGNRWTASPVGASWTTESVS